MTADEFAALFFLELSDEENEVHESSSHPSRSTDDVREPSHPSRSTDEVREPSHPLRSTDEVREPSHPLRSIDDVRESIIHSTQSQFITEEDNNATGPPAAKRLRLLTEAERIERDSRSHPVMPGCGQNCKRKCKEIDEETRNLINTQCWSMTHDERAQWRYGVLKITHCARSMFDKGESRRDKTVQYFLTSKDKIVIEVCKTFF